MFATGCIQAMIRRYQPIDRLSPDDVGLDYFVNIVGRYTAIPDPVRVDHDVGPMFALIEAARLICAYFPFKSQNRKLLLE